MKIAYDSIEQFDDVESKNMFAELCASMTPDQALEKINFGSRDNQRRPFCWDSGENGGFTAGKPWIPLHSEQKLWNLERDLASEKSVWRFYRDLLHLRLQEKALTEGVFRPIAPRDASYCVFTRGCGDDIILVVCNFEKEQAISVPGAKGKLLLSNYGLQEKNDSHYEPYEVAVFRVKKE